MEFFKWKTISPYPNVNYFIRHIPHLGSIIKIEKINVQKIDLKEIEKLARREKALLVKIEPFAEVSEQQNLDNLFSMYGYVHDFWPLSATATYILDLQKPFETITVNFKSKFRYNFRLAENKHALKVQKIDGIDLANNPPLLHAFTNIFNQRARQIKSETHSFRELLHTCQAHGNNLVMLYVENPKFQKTQTTQTTRNSDGQSIRKSEDIQRSSSDISDSRIFPIHRFSEYSEFSENPMLAAALFLFTRDICHYWHNGSTPEGRSLFAPTLIITEGIKLAQEKGCKIFEFEGIYDERFPDQTKRWKGFTKFKEGFGPEKIVFVRPYIKYFSPVFKFFHFFKMI
jgi:lipid II:glycine glycyltransferase (peptidoglycan interpeptide bridge formation enzyme)